MDLSFGSVDTLFDCYLLLVSCMLQMTFTRSGAPDRVTAGPISHVIIQYMDFVEIFDVLLDLSRDFSTIYFAHFY